MTKIIIVEDNDTIRKGLKHLINSAPGFSCVADFCDCESMLDKIENIAPDVLLIDIDLPGISGIEGIKAVKKVLPDIVVLVLLIYKESEKLYEALCAGAHGYLEKNTPPSRLLTAIKTASKGGSPMSAQIALKIQEYFQQKKFSPGSMNILSNIEKGILNELISGNSYHAIAEKLSMNIDVIHNQFRSIYGKLQYHMKLKD